MERPILEIKNLQTYFYVDGKVLRAVDGLSYSVGRGECVAVVGESASGKASVRCLCFNWWPTRRANRGGGDPAGWS